MTNEQQLIETNELMSKIIFEILHRSETGDEKISNLLEREDWKERTEFKLTKYDGKWWMGDPEVNPWVVEVDRILVIFKQLNNFKKIVVEAIEEFHDPVEETSYWLEQLIEEIEDGKEMNVIKNIIENLEIRLEEEEEKSECHLEALTEVSKKWNEKKLLHWVRFFLELNADKDNLHSIETKNLENKISGKAREVEEKSQKLEKNRIKLDSYKSENEKLRQELQEKSEKLEQFIKKNKEQKVQISQLKETLSHYSTNLPKKLSRFQQFKARTKTGFQKLIEKKKHRVQELIARIEVKK